MKKIIISLIILIILVISTITINNHSNINNEIIKDSNKINIITTIFPIYDFINNVGGDKVQVSILIPPGVEVHDYEPTPQDIILINDSDLFIYMGENIEYWAKTLINGVEKKEKIIDIAKNIEFIENEKFEAKYGIEDNEEEHEHDLEKYDTHIWLDPTKSIEIVNNIKDELCNIDSKNANYYKENAENYISELVKLDSDIMDVVSASENKKIAFGGPFAYAYFIERYNLSFVSAYDSCGENGEPSVFKVKQVIEKMKNDNIDVIFYKELSSGNIAKTISEETGANMLEFNSIHTVTEEQLNNNISYISIMRKNLENLKEALK